jgi:hypothetical protein
MAQIRHSIYRSIRVRQSVIYLLKFVVKRTDPMDHIQQIVSLGLNHPQLTVFF